jgi:hypothetical protein
LTLMTRLDIPCNIFLQRRPPESVGNGASSSVNAFMPELIVSLLKDASAI